MLYPIELLGQERALMVTSSGRFVMFRFRQRDTARVAAQAGSSSAALQFVLYVGKLTSIKTDT